MKKLAIMLLVVAVASGFAQEKKAAKKKAPAKKVEMTTTASGLKYHDDVVGTGPEVKDGDSVEVHYTGTFPDGKVFDSSIPRKKPFDVVVGKSAVIKCWHEGLRGMKVGGKRKLVCPPELAYGSQGYPGAIPPNATINFDLELLKIK